MSSRVLGPEIRLVDTFLSHDRNAEVDALIANEGGSRSEVMQLRCQAHRNANGLNISERPAIFLSKLRWLLDDCSCSAAEVEPRELSLRSPVGEQIEELDRSLPVRAPEETSITGPALAVVVARSALLLEGADVAS